MLLLRVLALSPLLVLPLSGLEQEAASRQALPIDGVMPELGFELPEREPEPDLRAEWMPELAASTETWEMVLRLLWDEGLPDRHGERRRWSVEDAVAAALASEEEVGRADAFARWVVGEARWAEAVSRAEVSAWRAGRASAWPVAELPLPMLRVVLEGWERAQAHAERLTLVAPIARKYRTSSRFGFRRHPVLKRRLLHAGVDLAVPVGTEVVAASGGVVRATGNARGSGRYVVVDHGAGIHTSYFHLDQIDVRRGQALERGAVVGRSGRTGRVTGPHLHFELRVRGEPVDPAPLFVDPDDAVADLGS